MCETTTLLLPAISISAAYAVDGGGNIRIETWYEHIF